MDFISQYCPERKLLEQSTLDLVDLLSASAERLIILVGRNHAQFMATKAGCSELRLQILQSHNRLLVHRAAHGC